jgi:sulfoxide reductase heme-binding subunit YedZ
MSAGYQAVLWNPFKKRYDLVLLASIVAYVILFAGITLLLHPTATLEIVLIRAFGTAAIILLHIILCIGPLARLNDRWLPLLYNRRHLGVSMFLLALTHAILVIATYHAGGKINPILSVFVTDTGTTMAAFPFQALGFFALLILFVMAATSHDFWLANLTAPVWKALHMGVYVAYGLVVSHVAFGVLQAEVSPIYAALLSTGFLTVAGLHLSTGFRERDLDRRYDTATVGGFVEVCRIDQIVDNRARIVSLSGERVAVFKYDGKVSAVSNVCQHQNGPLGEGKIVDGCITCPWHGYQYNPDDGKSPPPFTEEIPTFNVKVVEGRIYVHPKPNPAGTRVEPAVF